MRISDWSSDVCSSDLEKPVEELGPRRDRDHHRRDAEEAVDARPRPHGEEMVQPDDVGQYGDTDRRVDHRRIAEEALAREGRGDFGEDAEQDRKSPRRNYSNKIQPRKPSSV